MIPPPEDIRVATRAYAVSATTTPQTLKHKRTTVTTAGIGPSPWVLVFDTETTTDAAQRLRFGVYQVRYDGRLVEQGMFYDADALTTAEGDTLRDFAERQGYVVRSLASFADDVFFAYVYDLNATCVGFNLPFDLSRLAWHHGSARGQMRGGFTFRLCTDPTRPYLQVKHLDSRAAFIQFAAPRRQRTARSGRGRGDYTPVRRGTFTDAKTLGAALLGGSHSLASLAKLLDTPTQKAAADDHGAALASKYLQYAATDVQVTWECYDALMRRYATYGLDTPAPKLYSEAGLGKAYLKQMGVRPWREVQPNVSPALLGVILSSYYGGRAEVKVRRQIVRVLYCDFLSMYPTVCTLMGLWRFVIARRMTWRDDTAAVRAFLKRVTLDDLQQPDTWTHLHALVRVRPDADVLPVRADYGGEGQRSIGVNHLTADGTLWYTLADCVASTLLTGKPPHIAEAIRFAPVGMQPGLVPLDVLGDPAQRVDPAGGDFYRDLIDLRGRLKRDLRAAKGRGDAEAAARLDAAQYAVKIMANATSYGIFAELNVAGHDDLQAVTVHGATGAGMAKRTRTVEEPGRYFHPLLGTLITGAARLMLAIAERRATDAGLTWAFCDTDSMALAMPAGMNEGDFLQRADAVRDWFAPLNPYTDKGEQVFKVEDANYGLAKGKRTSDLQPLYCYAVSAKRYALFNLDAKGRPVIRKASAHGLGHLRPPYSDDVQIRGIPTPIVPLHELGVARWQHDVWHRILVAALGDHPAQVKLHDLPGFDAPAVSRYAATSPHLLRWFRAYNAGKPYAAQVRPFGFLLAFHAARDAGDAPPRAVAPFDGDIAHAAAHAFDRDTRQAVAPEQLRTYGDALAQYHLHPEAKFRHGDYADSGPTGRRHLRATGVEHIGKEANRWEEQVHLGVAADAQPEYGTSENDSARLLAAVREGIQRHGVRAVAREAGVAVGTVSQVLNGKTPKCGTISTLLDAIRSISAAKQQIANACIL